MFVIFAVKVESLVVPCEAFLRVANRISPASKQTLLLTSRTVTALPIKLEIDSIKFSTIFSLVKNYCHPLTTLNDFDD